MNEDYLKRLLDAASWAGSELPEAAPEALTIQVLKQVRDNAVAADEWLGVQTMLRRAMVGSCLVAILAVAFEYSDLHPGQSEESLFIASQVVDDVQ